MTRQHLIGISAATIASAGCTESPFVLIEPEGTLEVVVSGLSSPVHLTAPVGDPQRLFVVEQDGRIRIIRNGSVLTPPFLDIDNIVGSGGERGLLSLAFHPDYANNGHFFVNYTDNSGDTQIARYTISTNPDVADPNSAAVVLSITQPFSNHNGGQIAFGRDGMLYIGMGDGGSGGDPQGHGQNPVTLLGSLLRINVNSLPYRVPTDNPFVGHPTHAPETWAYGLRNPWRFSFDRTTGDLYIGDVGQRDFEEVSFQPASSMGGENYGWNVMEGGGCYPPNTGCDRTGLTLPIHEYAHDDGCSISGGAVYRGSSAPTLEGRYFFADYCRSWIRSFRVANGVAFDVVDHEDVFGPVSSITAFGEDGLGELYVVTHGGTIYRIVEP